MSKNFMCGVRILSEADADIQTIKNSAQNEKRQNAALRSVQKEIPRWGLTSLAFFSFATQIS